jgi:hypothetical protein
MLRGTDTASTIPTEQDDLPAEAAEEVLSHSV